MYLPGILISGPVPAAGTETAASGGFYSAQPAGGAPGGVSASGAPGTSPASNPLASSGPGDWLPAPAAVLDRLRQAGKQLETQLTFINHTAPRGESAGCEAIVSAPPAAPAAGGCKWWLLGAAGVAALLLSGRGGDRGSSGGNQ